MSEYYKKNRDLWKPGGKYYYYKAKTSTGKLTVKRGTFIIDFN